MVDNRHHALDVAQQLVIAHYHVADGDMVMHTKTVKKLMDSLPFLFGAEYVFQSRLY